MPWTRPPDGSTGVWEPVTSTRLPPQGCRVAPGPGPADGEGKPTADEREDAGDDEGADRRRHPALRPEPDRSAESRPDRDPPRDVAGVDELVGDETRRPGDEHRVARPRARRQVPAAFGEHEEVDDEDGEHRDED